MGKVEEEREGGDDVILLYSQDISHLKNFCKIRNVGTHKNLFITGRTAS